MPTSWTPSAPGLQKPGGPSWFAVNVTNITGRIQRLVANLGGTLADVATVTANLKQMSIAMAGKEDPRGNLVMPLKQVAMAAIGGQGQSGAATMVLANPLSSVMVGQEIEQGALAASLSVPSLNSVGAQAQSGSMGAVMSKASAALLGTEQPQGVMSVTMKALSDTMIGAQAQTGSISGALKVISAAINAGQGQSGSVATTLIKLAATLTGGQSQSGTMATALQQAMAAIAGNIVSSVAKPNIKSTNTSSTTTCTIGSHVAGDLIILVMYRLNATQAWTAPTATGTVPAWVTISNTTGANSNNIATFQFVATATNHTSGTWTGAGEMIAIVIGKNTFKTSGFIGGQDILTAVDRFNIVCPPVTLGQNDGSSQLIHVGCHRNTVSALGTVPTGYTLVDNTSDLQLVMITKNDTTSDGAMTLPITGSTANAYYGTTIEILAH